MTSTAKRGEVGNVMHRPWMTNLGKLLAAAIILTPLVAMLFPELNQRSGTTPSKSRQTAHEARSPVAGSLLTPFHVKRSGL
jgi:hypothetical protein